MTKPTFHELKVSKEYYEAVLQGIKTAEWRVNDRNFLLGDYLLLREYEHETEKYTGRYLLAKVRHIVYGGIFGMPQAYCMTSIKVYETSEMQI